MYNHPLVLCLVFDFKLLLNTSNGLQWFNSKDKQKVWVILAQCLDYGQ